VGYAKASEKRIQFLIFPTPISFHGNDLAIQESLNVLLKHLEFGKHIRFMLQKLNPCKFGIVINEAYIIIEFASRARRCTPHI
jgi:hypothetical protein